ncbi:FUSC family protein [Pseudonocardia sp. DLS-67]
MPAILTEVRPWLRRRDPRFAAVRRAARVTVAACLGFYACQYLLGESVTALYALFAAIALGLLSDIDGSPAERTWLLVGALPAGLVLVTLGTVLAVNVWAAAAGMLLVGFAVAFSTVGGPRIAGLANGLQLLYILPCFPPYDPDSLPARLAGLVIGVGLLALADRVLWPAPAPRAFADRLAGAMEPVGRYAVAIAASRQPAHRGRLGGCATAAVDAVEALRLDRVPRTQRPVGPGVHDRSLGIAAIALQSVTVRLTGLVALLDDPALRPQAREAVARLVAAVGDALGACAPPLRGSGQAPALEPLDNALAGFLSRRATILATHDDISRRHLRVGAEAVMTAQSTRSVVVGTRAALGVAGSAPRGVVAPATFAYLGYSPAKRWWRRLQVHLTPRSVYFQNAVRLAVGLAAARVVADLPDISHGFWVMLATLTLMRTSLVASRAALGPAFAGVIVGAVVAGVLLVVVGDRTEIYAWFLPVIMAVGFAAGPLLGPAAGQAGFTVVVAVVFAQLAPSTWHLAETRMLDVILGGLIGALIGAAVWPRGGAGEVRRSAAAVLRAGADDVVATARELTSAPARRRTDLAELLALLDATYAQFRSEGAPASAGPDVNWLAVLGVSHRLVEDADLLRGRYPAPGPLPWPAVGAALTGAAAVVAHDLRVTATTLATTAAAPTDDSGRLHARLSPHPPAAEYGRAPSDALRVVDVWGWLHGLADDLSRLHGALTSSNR